MSWGKMSLGHFVFGHFVFLGQNVLWQNVSFGFSMSIILFKITSDHQTLWNYQNLLDHKRRPLVLNRILHFKDFLIINMFWIVKHKVQSLHNYTSNDFWSIKNLESSETFWIIKVELHFRRSRDKNVFLPDNIKCCTSFCLSQHNLNPIQYKSIRDSARFIYCHSFNFLSSQYPSWKISVLFYI